jgi:hypothetical protein
MTSGPADARPGLLGKGGLGRHVFGEPRLVVGGLSRRLQDLLEQGLHLPLARVDVGRHGLGVADSALGVHHEGKRRGRRPVAIMSATHSASPRDDDAMTSGTISTIPRNSRCSGSNEEASKTPSAATTMMSTKTAIGLDGMESSAEFAEPRT